MVHDIYSATKPLWLFSRLMGLHASKLENPVRQAKLNKDSTQFAEIFWTIYTGIILIIGFFFEYAFEVNDASLNVGKIVQFADELITVFNTSTFCVCVVYGFIHRNTLRLILQEFSLIEENMIKNLYVGVSYRLTSSLVKCGLLLLIIVMFLSVAVLFTIPSTNRLVFIKGWVLYYIFIDIGDVYILEFIILVFILQEHLKILEKKISLLKSDQKIDELKTMLSIKTCSRNLYEISLKINNMFSIPLFFSVANSFISLFSGMYFSLFGFIYGIEVFTPRTIIEFLPTIILLSRHLIKLLSIAVICESTYTVRKNIGWTLHFIQIDARKQSFRQNVTEYSMQLIHERMSFNASGFFDINSKTLQMVISSVTIYLVILIQFDMAANQD